jgi:hypothetical protein
MKLHNTVQNEAVLSNVGEIGEFRIRNSAKAFNILSSGLYANKIRAIVRELSCNAVDSHTAAGKQDTPFDVHLPNQFEPHFSIRDYGTGLSHEQVTNIYTTYFESTKTDSNAFIGALGLGSKSPFSYTDNFTVTAVKDGRKGIYTAFINDTGVPSIALMMEEHTNEPAGVEVKFAVNDYYDFRKFADEARSVYQYFNLKPNISGYAGFEIPGLEYETSNIIPGVHTRKNGGRNSVAIMGNIAYPIEIPNSQRSDGTKRDWFQLLSCNLVMEFGIGELDFQASREGLSYIPETIKAIEDKLIALNNALTGVLAKEADAIPNLWDRAVFLLQKKEYPLWMNASLKYAIDTKLTTVDVNNPAYLRSKTFSFKVADLAADYNIVLRGFTQNRHNSVLGKLKESREYGDKLPTGTYDTYTVWNFSVSADNQFVVNDTKVGTTERAKDHFRSRKCASYSRNIYIIEPADRKKPVKSAEFFAALQSPPEDRIMPASALDQVKRSTGMGRDVSIMRLEERGNGGYYREKEMVWRECNLKASSFDATKTYYYVPLSGFTMISSKGYTSAKDFYQDVTSLPGLFAGEIYGVRKSDIKAIEQFKNWINLEDHISKVLNAKNNDKILLSIVRSKLDKADILHYNSKKILPLVDSNSLFAEFVSKFAAVDKFEGKLHNVEALFQRFAPSANFSPATITAKYQVELDQVNKRYPLLRRLDTLHTRVEEIAEYISLVDSKKETKNESV